MHHARLLSLVLLACLAPRLTAEAIRVVCTDGRILQGELIGGLLADPLQLAMRSGGLTGVINITHTQIAALERPDEAYHTARAIERRAAALGSGGSAEDWWRLALASRPIDDDIAFRSHARRCLTRDPDFPPAAGLRAELGLDPRHPTGADEADGAGKPAEDAAPILAAAAARDHRAERQDDRPNPFYRSEPSRLRMDWVPDSAADPEPGRFLFNYKGIPFALAIDGGR